MKLIKHGFQGTSPVKINNEFFATKTIRSRVSPMKKPRKKMCSSCTSSDSSLDYFHKVSILDSSETQTMGSPVIKIEKIRSDSTDYKKELEFFKRQNLELQLKIESLQRRSPNTPKRSIPKIKETDRLIDENKGESDQSVLEKGFEDRYDKIIKIEKFRRQSQEKKIEETLTEKFQNDLTDLEKLHEEKMQNKIKEISAEFERKLNRAQDEILWLRKQNESLKRNQEEVNSRLELVTVGKNNDFSNIMIEQNKKFLDIQKQFAQLQDECLKAKEKGSLCQKCKAFTETNNEISSKILRLKSFIESNNI